ncbi:hypothetical protein BKA69DRAFT_1164969 [Paraphysoderma sedebokerense]|nr:hypothetical protein BKA69DRAFT_1164969 [Paraphysoderma sedebokerense]
MKSKNPTRNASKGPTHILDESTRKKANQRHLEELERDNFTLNEELDGILGKKSEDFGPATNKRKKKNNREVRRILLLRKSLAALIEESQIAFLPPDEPSYLTCSVGPSQFPPRKFCSLNSIYSYALVAFVEGGTPCI